jgi:hypothetical protein
MSESIMIMMAVLLGVCAEGFFCWLFWRSAQKERNLLMDRLTSRSLSEYKGYESSQPAKAPAGSEPRDAGEDELEDGLEAQWDTPGDLTTDAAGIDTAGLVSDFNRLP